MRVPPNEWPMMMGCFNLADGLAEVTDDVEDSQLGDH